MKREDIIAMAREAGADYCGQGSTGEILFGTLDVDLERFARLIAAHEREECAKVCERWVSNPMWQTAGEKNAAAIRAIGETK